MARYVHVDDSDGEEFEIGVTHPVDPEAPPGQMLHPEPTTVPQFALREELVGLEDALDDAGVLKTGWYDLDAGIYLGRDRPDE